MDRSESRLACREVDLPAQKQAWPEGLNKPAVRPVASIWSDAARVVLPGLPRAVFLLAQIRAVLSLLRRTGRRKLGGWP